MQEHRPAPVLTVPDDYEEHHLAELIEQVDQGIKRIEKRQLELAEKLRDLEIPGHSDRQKKAHAKAY